jgi:hypothetical protein
MFEIIKMIFKYIGKFLYMLDDFNLIGNISILDFILTYIFILVLLKIFHFGTEGLGIELTDRAIDKYNSKREKRKKRKGGK